MTGRQGRGKQRHLVAGAPVVARLAARIDQTVLKPLAISEVAAGYRLATEAGCACFVTHAAYLRHLRRDLPGGIPLAAVIDFPFGLSPTRDKLRMVGEAAARGAAELDIVINLERAAAADYRFLNRELAALEQASRGLVRKVIVETAYRDRESLRRVAEIVACCGLEFVKTSTGYAQPGARVADVRFLSGILSGRCRIKASGGIGDLRRALMMLTAGAERIGTSRGMEILSEARFTTEGEVLHDRLLSAVL